MAPRLPQNDENTIDRAGQFYLAIGHQRSYSPYRRYSLMSRLTPGFVFNPPAHLAPSKVFVFFKHISDKTRAYFDKRDFDNKSFLPHG